MPKDKNLAKHKSRFEVRGGVINEFDFHQNQRALAEEEHNRFARQEDERRLREGETTTAGPQAEAGRIEQLMSEAHEKVLERREKESKPNAAATAKGATKSAKKASGKKVGAKRAGAKKAAARKGTAASTKRSGAQRGIASKRGAGKGSAKKTGAKKRGATVKATGKKSGAKKGAKSATRKQARRR